MPILLVPFVNEVFEKTYTNEAEVLQIGNERFTINRKVITDAVLSIDKHLYHIECQSKDDGAMSIRMLEYDFVIAYDNMRKNGEPYRLQLPESCVVYLRKDTGKTGLSPVEVVFPGGEQVSYSTKVINMQDYGIEEIFEKKLLMFLPFYILRYEKEILAGSKKSEAKVEKLVSELVTICEKLKKALGEIEKENYYADLILLIVKISDYLVKPKNVKERIGEAVMGGKVLTLWSEELLAEGMAKGIRIAIEGMIEQNIVTEVIAKATNVTPAEVEAIRVSMNNAKSSQI